MNNDYLWDRSGPPDPEIERLEQALAPHRYRHRADFVQRAQTRARTWLSVAASMILVAVAAWQVRMPVSVQTNWQIAGLEGEALVDSRAAALSTALRSGQVVRTGRAARITLESDETGRISLGPESELIAAGNRRVELRRGLLHAFIWAVPLAFEVETPSARAIDLGCEYTVQVDENGNGLLRVTFGWVAFLHRDQESFIPEGAACRTRQRGGPGIPFYEEAPESFRRSLAAYEQGEQGALAGVLAGARPEDGLTLWHLLTRAAEREQPAVFDRFAQLVELPPEVTREGVLRRDAVMIDRCWDALGLENTGWWRGWQRNWKPVRPRS
jgi:hypothetical protein